MNLLCILVSRYDRFLCTNLLDAGAFVLHSSPADCPHLWSENTWVQLDVGLEHLPRWSDGSGNFGYCVFVVIYILCRIKMQHTVSSLMFTFGRSVQTQWCHIGASLHSRTPFTYRVPADKWWAVITLNVLLAAAPALLALRCHTGPAYFMKPVPTGQTNSEKKKK